MRPLALRDNLTPDAMDFYLRITGESASAKAYDYAKHKITSPLYQERAILPVAVSGVWLSLLKQNQV